MTRILFILKRREDYSQDASYSQQIISTGLLNSADFVSTMLLDMNVESKIVVVTDNDDIDREVSLYQPTHVIIEALWVVPSKFKVLTALYPAIKWIVRFHSEAPFIAGEGVAMSWIHDYMQFPSVYLGINATRFHGEVRDILIAGGHSEVEINERVIHLPNYYPVGAYVSPPAHDDSRDYINVGCFGDIRPLKNQLIQAIAALRFARSIKKKLHFHINIAQTKNNLNPILLNLQGLFNGLADQGHLLIEHEWMPHAEFVQILHVMDIGMQVSFSETFNIVAADMIHAGVPIVVSKEVPWCLLGIAAPTNSRDIAHEMKKAWRFPAVNVIVNRFNLKRYVKKSKQVWQTALCE